MTSVDERPQLGATSAYGLARPLPDELRRSIDRIFGEEAPAIWAAVCAGAGVEPARIGPADLPAVLDRMAADDDGALRLCAQSFLIRVRSFEHLSQADHIVRSAS
jgi:hypothetical protein